MRKLVTPLQLQKMKDTMVNPDFRDTVKFGKEKQTIETNMFMVSGHSHMEVNSTHSRIKKKSETLNICVPFEWDAVASIARKNPYEGYHVEDIKGLKRLQQDLKISNMKKDADGKQCIGQAGKDICPMILCPG